ncbi:hypothetical protein FGL86_05650 [Pistricoccus aurantiacus]|uniref:Uncharacterized protein n=1 Tax=Pistricoccus aurantiacus TaxID=1883414 RepID=A0A5B8SN98_9GAMM|nr:hypothetical protein [Pistricoccus aurantiacus]QEA38612.1 hypothetical protein FGL86_05650 [Pistricoccus aurantiacus]
MTRILNFPVREAHGIDMERYLTAQECLAFGQSDPFAHWTKALDKWFAKHPRARNRRNDVLRLLLADTWLVFHMACDRSNRLEMQLHHNLRWTQLQYHNLSDFELLVIVNDNLVDLRRDLVELSRQHSSQGRTDPDLLGIVQGIDRLNQRLDRLFDPESHASRQPEWTS